MLMFFLKSSVILSEVEKHIVKCLDLLWFAFK